MNCRCGAPVHAQPADIDLSATPALEGRVLVCENDHYLRLIHAKTMPRRNSNVRRRNLPRAAQRTPRKRPDRAQQALRAKGRASR